MGANCYARHISASPPTRRPLFGYFLITFPSVTRSRAALIHFPSFASTTCGLRQRLTAPNDFHDAVFSQPLETHTFNRSHKLLTAEKIPLHLEIAFPIERNKPIYTDSIVGALMLVIHGCECKWRLGDSLQAGRMLICRFPAAWRRREEEEEGKGLG